MDIHQIQRERTKTKLSKIHILMKKLGVIYSLGDLYLSSTICPILGFRNKIWNGSILKGLVPKGWQTQHKYILW